MTIHPKQHEVARKFAENLVFDLEDDILKVIERNEAYTTEGKRDICASHEFCDANMVMLETMVEVMDKIGDAGAVGDFITDALGKGDNEICDLWNAAWDEAIDNKFWFHDFRREWSK
jgi:hypothetical protein